MNRRIEEEMDIITLNFLLSQNMENSYNNNYLDRQKLYNLYVMQKNNLFGNLNNLQSIHTGFNPNLNIENMQNLGNINNILNFLNPNQALNLANLAPYAKFSNVATLSNNINNNEYSNLNSGSTPLNYVKSNDENAFNFIGRQTVIDFFIF